MHQTLGIVIKHHAQPSHSMQHQTQHMQIHQTSNAQPSNPANQQTSHNTHIFQTRQPKLIVTWVGQFGRTCVVVCL